MARTKQTARGAKASQPTQQVGMEPAVLGQTVAQEEEVLQEETEAQAEGAEVQEVEVAQPEEQVTAVQGPVDPAQPGTSTGPTPHSSASTGTAREVLIYMNKHQDFAKIWFQEVVEKQEQAYHDLIVSLVGLVEEKCEVKDLKIGIVGFTNQEVQNVLNSISGTSGKYIDSVDKFQVEVSKKEEEITRK